MNKKHLNGAVWKSPCSAQYNIRTLGYKILSRPCKLQAHIYLRVLLKTKLRLGIKGPHTRLAPPDTQALWGQLFLQRLWSVFFQPKHQSLLNCINKHKLLRDGVGSWGVSGHPAPPIRPMCDTPRGQEAGPKPGCTAGTIYTLGSPSEMLLVTFSEW